MIISYITSASTFIITGLNSALIKEHAYLDPGSGSFILQLILAALLGSLFMFKSYWKKIINFLRGKSDNEHKDEGE
ncbi:MAG: hypothetical protein WBD56_10080 [Anaerolineales bacterium]